MQYNVLIFDSYLENLNQTWKMGRSLVMFLQRGVKCFHKTFYKLLIYIAHFNAERQNV